MNSTIRTAVIALVASIIGASAAGLIVHADTGTTYGGISILPTPTRVLDSRIDGPTDRIALADRPVWATAVMVTVTVTNAAAAGFAVAYDCGMVPETSAATWDHADATTSALTVSALSTEGEVCVYSSVPTDVVVDVVAWTQTPTYWVWS